MDSAQLGKLQAEVEHLQEDVSSLKADVKELLALANKGKGGFWMGMTMASIIGAVIAWVVEHVALR